MSSVACSGWDDMAGEVVWRERREDDVVVVVEEKEESEEVLDGVEVRAEDVDARWPAIPANRWTGTDAEGLMGLPSAIWRWERGDIVW